MINYIRKFSEISVNDINIVGGKGANLGAMTLAGFNIPNGFCITTDAYKAFIKPQQNPIYKMLDNLDVTNLDAVRKTGQEIRDILSTILLPSQITKQVIIAWQALGDNNAYAVRSSATAEDLPDASFAGQQDTYLNVVGKEALLKNIQNCFISLFTDRAIIYRVQQGFDHQDVALSVVVQKMILPKSSGIMFTADPISGHRDIISIDASFGLGEALVSGLVSADLYKVDKLDFCIVEKNIGDKKIAIMPVKGGGVETVDLDVERSIQTLTDKQIIDLAKIGTKIETHYGCPQDIEWAIADDQIYITQSRPITSLFPIPQNGTTWPKTEEKVFLSFGHMQVMTDAMPPLALSFIKILVPFGDVNGHVENKHIFSAAGRIYFDLSNPLSHHKIKKIFPKMLAKADQLMSKSLIEWVKTSDSKKVSAIKLNVVLKLALPLIGQVIKRLFWQKHHNIPQEMSKKADAYLVDLQQSLQAYPTDLDRIDHIMTNAYKILHEGVVWKSHLIASMLAMFLTHKIAAKYAEKADIDALLRGLEGNVTTEMDLEVGDLADLAQKSLELKNYILSDLDTNEKIKSAANLEGGIEFIKAWGAFINSYGARATGEIDIYRPRWHEDPSALMNMLMGILKTAKKGAHRRHYQALVAENHEAVNRVIKSVGGGIFGFVRKFALKRSVYVLRELFPLREHHKFMIIRFMDMVKQLLLGIGKNLEKENKIINKDDIWFLSFPEIIELLRSENAFDNEVISRRRDDFSRFQKIAPPRLITSNGEILKATYDNADAPEDALLGAPVSAGIIEGIAKVIIDPTKEQLHAGEILVAPFTDPGWTPLFVNAAGLVTEVGGLMTHGSVIAREYGLPAVVGVLDATTIIKTGQKIRINGDAGYVEILSDDLL